jgi:large subunit ribosomal protein L7Ae
MDQKDAALEAIETARNTGKIKRGVNEVTKALERDVAKLVVLASDVSPPEVVMHIGPLAKEKQVPLVNLVNKEELGVAAGIGVPTSAVAVTEAGDAEKLIAQIGIPEAEEKKEEKPKADKKEKPKEEKKEEPKAEKKEKPKEEKKEEPKEDKKE